MVNIDMMKVNWTNVIRDSKVLISASNYDHQKLKVYLDERRLLFEKSRCRIVQYIKFIEDLTALVNVEMR